MENDMKTNEELINEIIEIESLLYDSWNLKQPPETLQKLKDLYNELGYFLTDAQKEEVIKRRRSNMIENSGSYSEEFLNKRFAETV